LKLFQWNGDKAESGYACPSIAQTAATLQNDAKNPHGLNCFGEFILRNNLDGMPIEQARAAGSLGSTPSDFKGDTFSRLDGYQQVIGNPKAPKTDKAYALFRAINCYAPAGYNSCGGTGRRTGRAQGLVPPTQDGLCRHAVGQIPAVLLVKTLWLGLLLLASPAFGAVDARDYDAFWLWSGVAPQPVLKQAKTSTSSRARSTPHAAHLSAACNDRPGHQRAAPHRRRCLDRLPRPHLHWPEQVYTQLLGQVQRWRDAGNPVVGIQIDFDARTQYLHEYATFLRDLRQRLPADLRLSITGLMDWSSNADPTAIAQLKGGWMMVVQTYQGRQHPGLRRVFAG
jgi:hypothetical protein